MPQVIHLTINGELRAVPAGTQRSLLVVLREDLGLTGAKYGCAAGACGACTVLANGVPVRSCVTPVTDLAGQAVTTIEGLAPHAVQAALVAAGAAQCGYCTPGMVLAAAALIAAHPEPDDAQIVRALDGNICRCCAYPRILRAVREAGRTAAAPQPASAARPGELARAQEAERLPQHVTVDGNVGLQSGAGGCGPSGPRVSPDGTVAPRATAAIGPSVPWDLTALAERDYFSVLPDGLVSVLPPAPSGRAGPSQSNGGVWIHVGVDGSVTAFAGKVDVGQDNRTALAMLVAEEIGVPLGSVRMVLGDTDICPFDIGTFGSRSMPDTGQALAIAAAAARQTLIAMAAACLEIDPGQLSATDGVVKDNSTDAAISYGDLLRGLRRTVVAKTDAPVKDRRTWRTAGQPTLKLEAAEAVAGAKRFTSDLTLPGMLHGKVLRPPAYGATLRAADLSRARAVPGVVATREGPFAGVAGPDPGTAAHALALIEAEWDLAPQPRERDLIAHLRSHPLDIEGWGGRMCHEDGDVAAALESADVQLAATYTTAYIAHVPLEPRAALAEWSDGRLTVWTGTQRPFGVRRELAEALGIPELGVRVIVAGTGSGFGGKHTGEVAAEAARLARAAARPVKVQWSREEEFTWGYFRPAAVIDIHSGATVADSADTVGGAGARAGTSGAIGPDAGLPPGPGSGPEPGTGPDAGSTPGPGTGPEPGTGNGFGSGGAPSKGGGRDAALVTLTAWEFTNINSGAAGILTPYRVPAKRITFQPADAPLPQGSYRALAATANNFARESHMDELAHELGVDPLEFRLCQLDDDRLAAVLRAAADRAGWARRTAVAGHGAGLGGPVTAGSTEISPIEPERAGRDRIGLGIACGMEKDGRVATCAEVSVTPAGGLDIHRIVTAYECGAVVNPDNVVNQIEGATIMALGGALFEAVHFGDGVILNASLSQYRVPRFSDVPPIEVVLLDRRDIPPAGAGETPLIAVAPALANAIFAATGQRLRSLPVLTEGRLPAQG
jgi:CO/xanthine dehydrogenase Mo-binding subunit/aerobic-type carbon monoxide dehydrogenase small subunit (CoxS/CutS family)